MPANSSPTTLEYDATEAACTARSRASETRLWLRRTCPSRTSASALNRSERMASQPVPPLHFLPGLAAVLGQRHLYHAAHA